MEGILLIDKPKSVTSFHLVRVLRRVTGVSKIGHAGTLDPFATGLMILLIGKNYTRQSALFLNHDKEYLANIFLGQATDSFDETGIVTSSSEYIPTHEEIEKAIAAFNGGYEQIPPMYSAKKIKGKKLYDLARKGITIERQPIQVKLQLHIEEYAYPLLRIRVRCSKGTYIRSLAHDIGLHLSTYAHLKELRRVQSGPFSIAQSYTMEEIENKSFSLLT